MWRQCLIAENKRKLEAIPIRIVKFCVLTEYSFSLYRKILLLQLKCQNLQYM